MTDFGKINGIVKAWLTKVRNKKNKKIGRR